MELMGFLKSFRSSITALRDTVRDLESKLEAAQRRREDLWRLRPPKAEVVDILIAYFDEHAKKYPIELQERLKFSLRGFDGATGSVGNDFSPDILFHGNDGNLSRATDVLNRSLWFFLRPMLIDGIRRAVEAMPDWEAGPTRAQLAAELAGLDREITDLEEQLGELAANAREAGITIETTQPRGPVQGRGKLLNRG